MSKAVDDILAFLRSEDLSDEDQAELIQRLRDGEGDEHKPAGTWIMHTGPGGNGLFHAEEAGMDVTWVHGPDVDPDDGLAITFYHGQMDGKPVIQIDGTADFRINVNDAPIWDQSTEVDYERRKVWVGIINDSEGRWVYVGTSEEAVYQDMRSNYSMVEYRAESNYEWTKRALNVGAGVEVNSYYVEEG